VARVRFPRLALTPALALGAAVTLALAAFTLSAAWSRRPAGLEGALRAVLLGQQSRQRGRPGRVGQVAKVRIPKGCGRMPLLPGSGPANVGCAYADGYADAAKLGAAVALRSVFLNLDVLNPQPCPNQAVGGTVLFCAEASAQLMKPFRAAGTFLAFGFVPISAVLTIKAVRPIHVEINNAGYIPNPVGNQDIYKLVAVAFLSGQVSDVRVNGVPLQVGPSCQTVRPFKLILRGTSPEYQSIVLGGPLYGEAALTPFTGCVASGDDLDPLLTASVSGPRNFTLVEQGNLCVPRTPGNCPPQVPVLRR